MNAKEGFIYNSNQGFVTFSAKEIIFKTKKDGTFSKIPRGLPVGWQHFTEDDYDYLHEELKLGAHEVVCVQTGENSNITVFDFDIASSYDNMILKFPKLKDYYTIKTRRGYHIYFEYDCRVETSTNVFQNYPGIDIRNNNGFVYGPGTSYKNSDGSKYTYDFIGGDIKPLSDELFNLINFIDARDPETDTESVDIAIKRKEGSNDPNLNKIEKLCDLISVEYLADFKSWRKIMWALKKEGVEEEFASMISEKADNYTDEGFNNIWNKVPDDNKMSAGTIHHYAKLSNSDEYFKIMDYSKKLKLHDLNDKTFVDLIMSEIGDDFVCTSCIDGKINYYTWYDDAWHCNNDPITRVKISEFMNDILVGTLKYHQKLLLSDTENQEKHSNTIKYVVKCIERVCNTKPLSCIMSYFKDSLAKKIECDNFDKLTPSIIKFNNIAIDVMTGKEFIIEKHHRVTQSTMYDYVKSSNEQLKTMDDIWNDIFPDPEVKKCYLSIMKQSFTGYREEKFYMANGCGRNGKGLLNELALNTLGPQYALKGNISVLTQPFKKDLNVSLAEMNKKRLAIFNEPNDGVDKLQLGNIKACTGDGNINARSIYSNNTGISMVASIIFECNQKPDIQGRVDNAIISRFINVPFNSYFTDNVDELNCQGAKMINKTYKTSLFQSEYKTVLFDYVVKYGENNLYVPKQIIDGTKDYLLDVDEFLTWFNEHYEPCEDGIITAKQLYTHYKIDFFPELTKAQRRCLPEKKFKENNIMANITLKKHYFDRKSINKIIYRSVIIGFKQRAKLMCDEFGIPILNEDGEHMTFNN